MMHKLVCLALRHRFRVVQEFSPQCRRIKCERCGGDWGMSDAHYGLGIKAMLVEWDPDFEQFFRDMGFEILEPLEDAPLSRLELLGALTWAEIFRAVRWTGAIAVTLSSLAGYAIEATGVGDVGLIAVFVISYGTARLLGQRAIERAYERKCNSLEA